MDAVHTIGNILFPWNFSLGDCESERVSWDFRTRRWLGGLVWKSARYGHYVRDAREPDFATLLRICAVLDVTPNDLLAPPRITAPKARDRWMARLAAAARKLETEDLKLATRQVEALMAHRREKPPDRRHKAASKR